MPFALFWRAERNRVGLFLYDPHTALDELILKHRDLIFQTEVDAGVHLQQHARNALANSSLLALDGNLPKNPDALHHVRGDFGADLDRVGVELSVLDGSSLPRLGFSAGCGPGNVVVLHDELIGPEIDQKEESLYAVVTLEVQVHEAVVICADCLHEEGREILVPDHARISAEEKVVADGLQPG